MSAGAMATVAEVAELLGVSRWSVYERIRRHEIPVPTELIGDLTKPEMTIRTKWLSFIIQFTKESLVVNAELSLAARMLATAENRKVAVQFINSIADDLNL